MDVVRETVRRESDRERGVGGGTLIEGCLNKRFVFLSSGWVGLGFGFSMASYGTEVCLPDDGGASSSARVYGNIWPGPACKYLLRCKFVAIKLKSVA